jgi:glycosyltransferase involved in cell wall biosynthesis
MKFLYIGSGDVFSRHELGFIAALSALGNVDVITLGFKANVEKMKVGSDNGVWNVTFHHIPCGNMLRLSKCKTWIEEEINTEKYHTIFATPRLPILVAKSLSNKDQKVILRLWSIRAAKLRDNLRFDAYEDAVIYMPSILANFLYILSSTYAIAVDHATYTFAVKTYPILASRLTKLYPPYGFIAEQRKETIKQKIFELIERGNYVLGFTLLNKTGPYLKFEARPHAIVLYRLAKKINADVVLVGSTYEDWKRVFPNLEPPKNLHVIGRDFRNDIIAELYRRARMVVVSITNRSISNRLLEALFYGKPIITTEVAKHLHPELIHKKHIYISTWNNIVEDVIKLLEDEETLKILGEGAREAYNVFFSTKHNIKFIRSLCVRSPY